MVSNSLQGHGLRGFQRQSRDVDISNVNQTTHYLSNTLLKVKLLFSLSMWMTSSLKGNYEEEVQRLKDFLAKEFEIKDLGSLKYFLGMEVARSRGNISLSTKVHSGPVKGDRNVK